MSEYKINVRFTRNLDDDAEVVGSKKPTDKQLMLQFQKELQDAYNKHGIAGRFEIISVERT